MISLINHQQKWDSLGPIFSDKTNIDKPLFFGLRLTFSRRILRKWIWWNWGKKQPHLANSMWNLWEWNVDTYFWITLNHQPENTCYQTAIPVTSRREVTIVHPEIPIFHIPHDHFPLCPMYINICVYKNIYSCHMSHIPMTSSVPSCKATGHLIRFAASSPPRQMTFLGNDLTNQGD